MSAPTLRQTARTLTDLIINNPGLHALVKADPDATAALRYLQTIAYIPVDLTEIDDTILQFYGGPMGVSS